MSTRTIVHICLAGLFALAIMYIMSKWSTPEWQENPLYPLISIISLAIVGGIFFVTVILPRIGDAVGTVMYSSGEEIQMDGNMKAAAKMAAGDYEGAIVEYKKALADKPNEAYPISEIAKIYSDKLSQPDQAILFVQGHLEGKDWPEDDAAFLMFRMVDIYGHARAYDEAKNILEQIAGNFPGTRHSANARHKISELEQAEFKELQAERARQQAAQNEEI